MTSLLKIWTTSFTEIENFLKQYDIKYKTKPGAYFFASLKFDELKQLSEEESKIIHDSFFVEVLKRKIDFPFDEILICVVNEASRLRTLKNYNEKLFIPIAKDHEVHFSKKNENNNFSFTQPVNDKIFKQPTNQFSQQNINQPFNQTFVNNQLTQHTNNFFQQNNNQFIQQGNNRFNQQQFPKNFNNFQSYLPQKAYSDDGKTFLVFKNKPDGDCALHGLSVDNQNITRNDFVQKLLIEISNNSNKSQKLRNYIRPEIVSWCFLKLNRIDCDKEKIITKLTKKYIEKKLSLQSEYLSYAIFNEGSSGTLAAAALIYDLNVKIWVGNQNNLKLNAVIQSNSSSDYINLYHNGGVNELNHFDLLVEENDTKRLQRAEFKQKLGR